MTLRETLAQERQQLWRELADEYRSEGADRIRAITVELNGHDDDLRNRVANSRYPYLAAGGLWDTERRTRPTMRPETAHVNGAKQAIPKNLLHNAAATHLPTVPNWKVDSPDDRAMFLRHRAAMRVVADCETVDGRWKLLQAVVWPDDERLRRMT
jgi:hypothetical protein